MGNPRNPEECTLYRIRTARGLGVLELADRLGCSASLVLAWEDGSLEPSSLELGALCRILGFDPEEFGWTPPT